MMTPADFQTIQESQGIANLEENAKAFLNILEDFSVEKERFEETQRAMLNLLEDFGMEREKTEAVNRELREAEVQIKKSLREKEVLLKEIHHRVKNNLQIISSMLNLQSRHIKDPQTVELFKESQNRVFTMALIHEKLYQSESLARIDLSEYIHSLTANLFFSYGVSDRIIKLKTNIENVDLDADSVIPCALIVNELVSNSLKYAFPHILKSRENPAGKGEIRIDLRMDSGNRCILAVGDNGIGLPANFDLKKCESLGLKLVCVLAEQLKGTVKISTSGGTELMIAFEVTKKERRSS